jgi:hypothetical protein
MKSFKSLMESLAEAWPGTPEYKKKFGTASADGPDGSRHKIDRSSGITRATRKYDTESGESEEPTKSREDAAAAPAKRGRGRPPGKYGSYKKKIKESIEILEALETDEEIEEFVFSLDEESFAELEQYLSEEQVDEALKGAMHPDAAKILKHIKPEHHSTYKPYLKQGVYKGGYSDRAAVLSAAEKAGHVKEEVETEQIDEISTELKQKYLSVATKKHLQQFLGREKVRDKQELDKRRAAIQKTSKELTGKTHYQEEVELDEKYMGAEKLASSLASKGAKDPKALAAWIGRKKYGKEAFQKAAAKGEKMSEAEVDEALKHPKHAVLDKNKNNKLDKEDFQILRGEKKAPMKEEVSEDKVADIAAFITKQSKGEA